MESEYLERTRSLSELQNIIDNDRIAAAALANATFCHEITVVITSITKINAVATAEVLADAQLVSSRMLIKAEIATINLMVDAHKAIFEYNKYMETQPSALPRQVLPGMIKQISDKHTDRLTQQANDSIEAIQRDARETIAKFKDFSGSTTYEIRSIATITTKNIETAASDAANKLKSFRAEPHTLDETATEAEKAAQVIQAIANQTSTELQQTVFVALSRMSTTTDAACRSITAIADSAVNNIELAREKALSTIRTVLNFHME